MEGGASPEKKFSRFARSPIIIANSITNVFRVFFIAHYYTGTGSLFKTGYNSIIFLFFLCVCRTLLIVIAILVIIDIRAKRGKFLDVGDRKGAVKCWAKVQLLYCSFHYLSPFLFLLHFSVFSLFTSKEGRVVICFFSHVSFITHDCTCLGGRGLVKIMYCSTMLLFYVCRRLVTDSLIIQLPARSAIFFGRERGAGT